MTHKVLADAPFQAAMYEKLAWICAFSERPWAQPAPLARG